MTVRKYVSISGPTHAKLKEYCKLNGLSVAGIVDLLIKQHVRRKVTPVKDLLNRTPAHPLPETMLKNRK